MYGKKKTRNTSLELKQNYNYGMFMRLITGIEPASNDEIAFKNTAAPR